MPPVKRLLPPRSSAEAFSNTSTCAPASHAARAAVKAALPAPTTTTSLNSSGSSTLLLHSGSHWEPAAFVTRCSFDCKYRHHSAHGIVEVLHRLDLLWD